jgi:hypothetical protein
MEKMAGGMVQGASCSGTTLTLSYYKNLATDPVEGAKSPTGVSAGTADTLCQDVKCESGQECIGGACAEVTGECSKNSDCDEWCKDGEKCYCAINANYIGDDSACHNNFTGVCAVATTQSGVTGGYTVSADYMTWWSAVNFCKAHNASMVSLVELGITGGYQDDGYCEGSECGTVDWADLRNKIGDTWDFYWTTDAGSCDADWNCKPVSNNNSCRAFAVHLSSGSVNASNHYRSTGSSTSALCVDK